MYKKKKRKKVSYRWWRRGFWKERMRELCHWKITPATTHRRLSRCSSNHHHQWLIFRFHDWKIKKCKKFRFVNHKESYVHIWNPLLPLMPNIWRKNSYKGKHSSRVSIFVFHFGDMITVSYVLCLLVWK